MMVFKSFQKFFTNVLGCSYESLCCIRIGYGYKFYLVIFVFLRTFLDVFSQGLFYILI